MRFELSCVRFRVASVWLMVLYAAECSGGYAERRRRAGSNTEVIQDFKCKQWHNYGSEKNRPQAITIVI